MNDLYAVMGKIILQIFTSHYRAQGAIMTKALTRSQYQDGRVQSKDLELLQLCLL